MKSQCFVWERIANFEQVLWSSFCLNYPDLLFSRQFIEDTRISQFWFISKAFPNTVESSDKSEVLIVVFRLRSGIPWLKGTDRALYFSGNMKLKIEFIFFSGVHTLEKILTLCGMTCIKNYCFQPN